MTSYQAAWVAWAQACFSVFWLPRDAQFVTWILIVLCVVNIHYFSKGE